MAITWKQLAFEGDLSSMSGDATGTALGVVSLSDFFKKRVSSTIVSSASHTYTPAELLSGYIYRDLDGTSNVGDTFPLGADMLAAMTNYGIGSWFDFTIINVTDVWPDDPYLQIGYALQWRSSGVALPHIHCWRAVTYHVDVRVEDEVEKLFIEVISQFHPLDENTPGKMMMVGVNQEPINATNTDAEVAAAVTASQSYITMAAILGTL